jgi:histidinol-phosphatase
VFEEEIGFAHELADRASEIALSFFGGSFEVREKPDRSPVTEADIQIERTIREAVHGHYPTDGVLGEEGGLEGEGSDRRWVVDPIDGTKNFADGVQIWATLIALVVGGEPVVGVVSAPAIGERYDAVTGSGARLNGEPIHVSRADRIGRSAILHSSIGGWIDGPYREPLLDLLRESRRDRGFGDFWGHMLVARGSADVMFEPELATWDFAALQVVVTEAGGRVTQFDGSPVLHGGSVLTTNGVLHDELVARLVPGHAAERSPEVG